MKIKIYERNLLGGKSTIRIYVTENKNENIFEVDALSKS